MLVRNNNKADSIWGDCSLGYVDYLYDNWSTEVICYNSDDVFSATFFSNYKDY